MGAGARHRALHVRSDSLLLVQQMLGDYKVKHPGLQPLHAKARCSPTRSAASPSSTSAASSMPTPIGSPNTAMDGAARPT